MIRQERRKRKMEVKRTILIGDIHSCVEELEMLLLKLEYSQNTDRLIFLGDLTDRGYAPIETIRKVRGLRAECIMGNYDHRILKWLRHGKNTNRPIPDYYHQLNDDDIKYVQSMPAFIRLDDAIVIHGGIKPHIPVEEQSIETLAYLRYTEKDTDRFVSLKKVLAHGKEACKAVFWT